MRRIDHGLVRLVRGVDHMVGLRIHRVADRHQALQRRAGITVLEQRALLALAQGARDQRLEIGAQPDRRRAVLHQLPDLGIDEGTPTQGQDHRRPLQHAGDDAALQLAKARLAIELEDVGDAHPGGRHDLVVGIAEGHAHGLGQPPADRGLAGTHQPDEHDAAVERLGAGDG